MKRTLFVAESITDASFAPQGERSHQCSMTFLGGGLITCTSQRQAFMTQSTAECELVGLAHVLSDLEAQRTLFESLLEDKVQCVLYCDNKATMQQCLEVGGLGTCMSGQTLSRKSLGKGGSYTIFQEG